MRHLYQLREVSTLSFNERVLQEAEDRRNPLFERLKFLGIFSSNMDEFFKVRVAVIRRMIELGRHPMREVLKVVGEKSRQLDTRFLVVYQEIVTGLAQEGITILNERDLDAHEKDLAPWVRDYFQSEVLPQLVPLIVRRRLKFPQLTDGALYFGVKMWGEENRYAIIEIPSNLPRFVELPNRNIMYLDDVIRYSLNELFYIFEYDHIEAYEFKLSRDAELDIDNDFTQDYVRKMQEVLKQRATGRPTRLVYDATMPQKMLDLLVRELNVGEADTLIGGGRYHNMKDLMRFPMPRADLTFEPMEPCKHPVLDRQRTPILDIIQQRDLLVTYPYQSFDHVIRLIREAAIDPTVKGIQMSLYRVARDSQVVNALVNAARNGKLVTVCVELQARFDEEHNIRIAQRLREAGAKVYYGVPPYKVHGKLLLITRQAPGQPEPVHVVGLSTGNYNESTGALYVDSILLTAHPEIAAEVDLVFEQIRSGKVDGESTAPKFKHLLVSPFNLRRRLMQLIAQERDKGKKGYIFLKVNHLTDERIIRRLQEAADAGVKMDLVVRTTYGMVPHKNIRAISILDRFLEHQRCYIFGKGEDRQVFFTSADLMQRNLDSRIEVGFPVLAPDLAQEVADMMLLQVRDTYKARVLDETQRNDYVMDIEMPKGSDGRDGAPVIRAQYETHGYLRRLYTAHDEPAPVAVGGIAETD